MDDTPRIIPRENGPLVVENPPDLIGTDGAVMETKKVAALCRCGQSKNKPFCDGSHNDGFSSAPDTGAIRNKAIDYTGTVDGAEVTISYTPVLCTHAAECQARAGTVFRPAERPWINPENGTLPDILDVMAACPSGALRVSLGAMTPQHLNSTAQAIRIQKNGPYHVTNVALDAPFNGTGASHVKYSLCRCGLSKNKPFCDGTHHDAGWKDD